MCTQNKIDSLFKMREEELKTLIANNLSITEIKSIIEMLRNYDKVMDEKLELDEISYKENDVTKEIDDLKKQLDFSRKTLASDKELNVIKKQIDELMDTLSSLNNDRLAVIKKYEDIRTNIINICLDAIKNANDVKLELARQEKLDSYTVDLQVLINKKKQLEMTFISLNKSSNYRDNKTKIDELNSKIRQIEYEVNHGLLDMSIELTNEVVRYRNMIHELSLTDSNTSRFLQKINKELAYTNSKISEINEIIVELENMDISKYRELLLKRLTPSVIEQNYLSQKQVYDSFAYPIKVKDLSKTDELLDEFNSILESIKCPVISVNSSDNIIDIPSNLPLGDVDKNINYLESLTGILHNSLEKYNNGFDTKYIKSNVENNELFSVPFERSKWEEYFNIKLDEKDINFLNLINSKYLSLNQRFAVSKNTCKLSSKYKDIILELLDELYYKILSDYITKSNQYNITLDDYKDVESYNSYISSTKNCLSDRINKLTNLLNELKSSQDTKFDEVNKEYERLSIIKEELKKYLNGDNSSDGDNQKEDNDEDVSIIDNILNSQSINEDNSNEEVANLDDVELPSTSDTNEDSLVENKETSESKDDSKDINIFDQNIFADDNKEDNKVNSNNKDYVNMALDSILTDLDSKKDNVNNGPTFEVPVLDDPYTNYDGIDTISSNSDNDKNEEEKDDK